MERISTGNEGLDTILGGGLVRSSITLLVGPPGSGKTLAAEQCVFTNAVAEHPAIYLSTVSEPMDKLLRFGQSLDFFDAQQVSRSVFYDELGSVLDESGIWGALKRIDALIKEHRPRIVVIDSFKALKAFAQSEADHRRFLHELTGRVTALAVSSLWVGEYTAEDAIASPEFAVADTVIDLTSKQLGERLVRYLRVLKLRGGEFASGQHPYRLSSNGLTVFPRLTGIHEPSNLEIGAERVSTGIPALDEGLGNGYWSGSVTLVAGPAGSGKTLMGMHFLYAGAASGEPGVLATFQESRSQLSRIVDGLGWSLTDPAITIMDRSPVDVHIDEFVYELLDRLGETGSRRVVIDGLKDLRIAATDATRFRESCYSLVQLLAGRGISLMLTLEVAELFRITQLSDLAMSHMADNVVLLQHVHRGHEMTRALTVLKTRGASPASTVRELKITPEGITLGDALDLESSCTDRPP